MLSHGLVDAIAVTDPIDGVNDAVDVQVAKNQSDLEQEIVSHLLLALNTYLLIGFLSLQTWRLLTQKFCMETRTPGTALFPRTNNLLEFIASIITSWIDMILKCLQPGDCVLLMTNSTTFAR
jgi:hypothetical protein